VFVPTRYIAWALRFYGKVELDLATSGTPLARWSDLGLPVPDVDDVGAYARFRSAVASHNEVPPEEAWPAAGTTNALFLAYAALLSPGDEIVVETPGYEPLTRAAEGLGAVVRTFPRLREEGFRVDPDRVAAAMTPRTRAIVVTTLHNPTGVRVEEGTLRELAAIAEARSAYLLVDEVYSAFDDLPEDGVFRRSARKLAPNVVAISSLTKTLGLGMYRIGWLLGPAEVIERAEAAAIATVGHMPLAHASYGAAAFGAIGPLARRSKSLLAGKRAIAETWARTLGGGAHWSAPEAGLFGMVTLPGRGDLRPRIEELTTRAGVLVGAGTFFGAPESFRLSWATCDATKLAEGLDRLSQLARA
jgi:aspartate/methionine/tyrosine aminotransferase